MQSSLPTEAVNDTSEQNSSCPEQNSSCPDAQYTDILKLLDEHLTRIRSTMAPRRPQFLMVDDIVIPLTNVHSAWLHVSRKAKMPTVFLRYLSGDGLRWPFLAIEKAREFLFDLMMCLNASTSLNCFSGVRSFVATPEELQHHPSNLPIIITVSLADWFAKHPLLSLHLLHRSRRLLILVDLKVKTDETRAEHAMMRMKLQPL